MQAMYGLPKLNAQALDVASKGMDAVFRPSLREG